MPQSNLETARRFADAFNAGDLAAMQSLASADFELIPLRAAVEESVYEGHEGLAQWVADLAESWSEIRIDVEAISEPSPGTILVLGRVVGRGHGSRVPVESDAGWVARVDDGLARRIQTFLDPEAATRAATAES